MKNNLQYANQQQGRFLSTLFILALLIVCSPAAFAQAEPQMKKFLGRPTTTEYIFDTPLPADFSEMVTAAGQKYRAFQTFPKLSNQTIDGRNQLFVTTEIAWDGDKIDQGAIAFRHEGRVESGWWFNMNPDSPEWKALASRIKSQATANGNWRYAILQVLVTTDANQPPIRTPIPEIIQVQKKMTDLGRQTKAGLFYSSVQMPASLDAFRAQMLAYGNVGRRDPDFRKNHGSKTATNLGGDTVVTLGGTEKVFKQNRTPPYFSDSKLNDKLNLAAQFQAEYIASTNRLGHDGPNSFSDPRTGKHGNMHDLGMRADFFEIPRNIVEAAGGGNAGDYPHNWMAGDTHFRPWFGVDGIYPELGYGAAQSANGTWYFVAVATRYPDGVIPGGSQNPSAASGPAPSQGGASPATNQETLLSLQSHNFPDRFIRHRDYKGYLDPIASDLDKKDSTFKRVRGLADGAHVSLEAVNFPNFFLVADGETVALRQRPPNDAQFDRNATFIQQPGLADGSKLSLESHAQRGKYLRHTGFVLYVHPMHDSDLFRADATFEPVAPKCTGSECRRE